MRKSIHYELEGKVNRNWQPLKVNGKWGPPLTCSTLEEAKAERVKKLNEDNSEVRVVQVRTCREVAF